MADKNMTCGIWDLCARVQTVEGFPAGIFAVQKQDDGKFGRLSLFFV
jgi:hypothetical protein